MCYISIHLRKGKSFRHFHTNWNSKNTGFTIGGFLTSLPRSPLILCLLFQDILSNLEIINARDIQPIDFLVFISWHHLWELEFCQFLSLSSTIPFSDKRLQWFGQDRGLLIQAIKKVGMPLAIPTAIINLHLPCNHPLFNMRNPWQSLWRS